MKKSIAVVIDKNTNLQLFLEGNLKLVLGDYIDIRHYFIDEICEKDIIRENLVLVMAKDRLHKIDKNISVGSKVIVIRRTFQEDKIYELFSIPKGSKVLVVNDTDETTLETLSLFYKIGIKDLKLIPYKEEKEYGDIDIAITPGVVNRVPNNIKKIIDLGNRYIDISTFIEIINELKIDLKDIRKKLIKYSDKIITLEDGVKDKYRELFLKIEELDTVLNLSKDGIIFTSEDGTVKTINKNAMKILSIGEDTTSYNISGVFKDSLSILLNQDEIIDEVIFFNKRYLNVNKKSIFNTGDKIGTYYSFQEITYIKKLEQNLTSKLRQTGQVAKYNFNHIKTKNEKMFKCIEMSKKVSKSDLSVLIIGESGTGKEVIAQSIHNNSDRNNQPFIAVNCAAVPENLLESELFGYEKGTFTGGLKEGKKGLFEMANNGTIFLDEIGDMPPLLQTKLLRVLQEKQIMPVGSHNVIDIDVRVISATNKDLPKMIKENKFREDLYYRLNVLPINIPSLRERKEDVLDLLSIFLQKNIEIIPEVKTILEEYNWPGNVRELQNVASFLDLMCDEVVFKSDLPSYIKDKNDNKDCLNIEYSENEIKEILNIILSKNEIESGVGRSYIVKELKSRNIEITEARVRKILTYLKDNEYITCKSGRGGSNITEKGKIIYLRLDANA